MFVGEDEVVTGAFEVTIIFSEAVLEYIGELEPIDPDRLQWHAGSDIQITGGSLVNSYPLGTSGKRFGARVRPQADYEGDLTFRIREGAVDDVADNRNAAAEFTRTVDTKAPSVTGIDVTSRPADPLGYGYATGERITLAVTFHEPVEVVGESLPSFGIEVGDETRQAVYVPDTGTGSLSFSYRVQAADLDADGISYAKDSIALNGATIRDAVGHDAEPDDLEHAAMADAPAHQVNAALLEVRFEEIAASAEEGESVAFTVELTVASALPVTVQVATSDDTATSDDDFTALSETLTFTAGETQKTVTVTTHDDDLDEADETFTLRLSNATGATLPAHPTATGTILDNDGKPSVRVAHASAEEGKAVKFEVALSAESGRDVEVNVATSGGTATSDDDFKPLSETLTFTAGQTQKTVSVETIEDTLHENDETFTLTLSNARNAILPTERTATGTIIDDDLPVLSVASVSAVEGGDVSFTATLALASTKAVRVDWQVSLGRSDNAEPEDFADLTAEHGTLTIDAGQTTTGTVRVRTAVDTRPFEVNESFTLLLSNPVNATLADPTVKGTIVNRPPPAARTAFTALPSNTEVVLSWEAATRESVVAAGLPVDTDLPLFIRLSLNAEITRHEYRYKTVGGDYPATWTAIADSASGGANAYGYTVAGLSNETVHIFQLRTVGVGGNGRPVTSKAVTPTPGICDRTPQVRDAIVATVDGVDDCAHVNLAQLAAIWSLDDEYDLQGDGTANKGITLLQVNDFAGLTNLYVLNLASNELTELPTGVFAGLTNLYALDLGHNELTALPAGVFAGLTKLRGVSLSDNQLTEVPGELFAGQPYMATIKIRRNRLSTLPDGLFAGRASPDVLFVDGNTVDPLPLTVALETVGVDQVRAKVPAGAPFEMHLPVTVTDGALAGGVTTLTVAAGAVASTPVTVYRTAGTSGAVTVDLGTPLPAPPESHWGYVLTPAASGLPVTTLPVTTLPTLGVEAAAPANEGEAVAFTVTLWAVSTQDVTVDAATSVESGDTAGSNDFTAVATTLTIPAGETTATVSIPTTQDTTNEADETFTLTLSDPTNATLSTDRRATGTINDDDALPVLRVANASATEGDAAAFTVTLSPTSGRQVTVHWAAALEAADDTAASTDYTADAGTLTFTAGETRKTVSIETTEDTVDENNETFTLTLSNPSNAALAGGRTELYAIGTIRDNDDPPSLSVAGASAAERYDVEFTVTLSAASSKTVRVDVATSGGTATSNDDFKPLSETLTFRPGETQKTVSVETIEDTLHENDETFTLTLSDPTNATLSTDRRATGTIDGDLPVLSVASVSAVEGGDVSFTATLAPASTKAVRVDWQVSLGRSDNAEPEDFADLTAEHGTLTIDAGQTTTETVRVRTAVDTRPFEVNESFTLLLSNPVNATLADPTVKGTIVNRPPPAARTAFTALPGNTEVVLAWEAATKESVVAAGLPVDTTCRSLSGCH